VREQCANVLKVGLIAQDRICYTCIAVLVLPFQLDLWESRVPVSTCGPDRWADQESWANRLATGAGRDDHLAYPLQNLPQVITPSIRLC
jgi:hypothetical protein